MVAGLLCLAALLTAPGAFNPITGGLDPSWMWGLNEFSHAGFVFGRDVVFSYGPLGFLARPLDVGDNLAVATIIYWLCHLTIFATAWIVYLKSREPRAAVLFAAGYLVVSACDLEFDYQLMLIAGLLLTAGVELSSTAFLAVGAGCLAPIIFVKFGTGLAAGTALAVACFTAWWRGMPLRSIICAALAYLLCMFFLAWYLFGTTATFVSFLRLSSSLSHGYNDEMSLVGPFDAVVAALLLLVLAGATVALLIRLRPVEATAMVIFAIPIVFSAKHGFLRADWGHMAVFFRQVWAAGTVALLFTRTTASRALLVALMGGDVALFALTADTKELHTRAGAVVDVLRARRAVVRVEGAINYRQSRKILRAMSRGALGLHDRLPDEWRRDIGARPVLVLPSELALCPANDLKCVPYPTLQMYATLTRELDQWAADQIRNGRAEYAIVEAEAIDGRNMVWDCPETWLALMEQWEVARSDSGRPRVLLRRRSAPRQWPQTAIRSQTASFGDWIDVPQNQWPLRVKIDLRETLMGRLKAAFARSEPVLVQLKTATGRLRAYRLVVDTARQGILVHAMPWRAQHLVELFDCCPVSDQVRTFRLVGPGRTAFDQQFNITWSVMQADLPAAVEAFSEPQPALVPGDPHVAVDWINYQPISADGSVTLSSPSDGLIHVSGWAVDFPAQLPARNVILRWDDRLNSTADYGLERQDVARYLKNPAFAFSGFIGVVPREDLGAGRHRLDVLVVAADGKTASRWARSIQVDVP